MIKMAMIPTGPNPRKSAAKRLPDGEVVSVSTGNLRLGLIDLMDRCHAYFTMKTSEKRYSLLLQQQRLT